MLSQQWPQDGTHLKLSRVIARRTSFMITRRAESGQHVILAHAQRTQSTEVNRPYFCEAVTVTVFHPYFLTLEIGM